MAINSNRNQLINWLPSDQGRILRGQYVNRPAVSTGQQTTGLPRDLTAVVPSPLPGSTAPGYEMHRFGDPTPAYRYRGWGWSVPQAPAAPAINPVQVYGSGRPGTIFNYMPAVNRSGGISPERMQQAMERIPDQARQLFSGIFNQSSNPYAGAINDALRQAQGASPADWVSYMRNLMSTPRQR